jgi:hypothetical protein
MTDDDLVLHASAEIAARRAPMELVLQPASVFQLVALVQLALRHPAPSDAVRATGARLLNGAREYFADCPALLEMIRRGDDPQYDVNGKADS